MKLRYILSGDYCKESCFEVGVCSMKFSSEGNMFESCGMYHQVFIARNVVLKLRYILSSVRCKESRFKLAVCIIKCSLKGKLL